jgi:hypothetical protein
MEHSVAAKACEECENRIKIRKETCNRNSGLILTESTFDKLILILKMNNLFYTWSVFSWIQY